MSDSLLPYYERELDAIKRLAAEFADTHPKIAGRLRLSADAVDDPHVARLLEGVAFLAARVHHRLDDEFPELTDALLGLLYPHYLAPMPSCMVAQFDCQPDLMTPARLPAGMAIDTEPVHGEELRYRTTAPVTLWPVEVENVRLSGLPIVAPANPSAAGAAGVLRITLKCASPEATFTQLGVDRLRFFLRGPTNQALALYELLGAHAISIAYADSAVDPAPVIVPASRDRAGRLLARRGVAALVGTRLLRLSPADRILRLPGEVPVPRLHPDGHQDPGRPPATGWRSSSTSTARCRNWSAPSASNRWRSAARRWSICSRSAASRSRSATGHRIPRRARRPPPARRGGLERRAGARDPARRLVPTLAAIPSADRERPGARRARRLLPRGATRRPHRACRAPRCSSPRTTRTSIPTAQPRPCCRSMRCASTATCRPTCRSAAATRACVWWRAPPRSPR